MHNFGIKHHRKIILFTSILFLIGLTSTAFSFYVITCPKENINAINKTISDPAYFNNMYNADDCLVNQVADLTPNQIATQEAANQTEANLPKNKFNVNLFVEQLATTNLITEPNVLPYYAVIKDLCAFKNFQGLANLVAGLLAGGVIQQSDVNTLDTVLENQQMNLASYNAEVNVAY